MNSPVFKPHSNKALAGKPVMTQAERMRRWRARHGNRQVNFCLHVETAAALLYLRKQWGFNGTQETVEAALRYLAVQTRKGLTKLELTID